jgi:phosphonate transport system substrate-binding protein
MNRLLAAALPALLLAALPAAAQTKITIRKLVPLSLGLTGYSGAESARQDSAALQKYLAGKLNREVTTKVFPDFDTLTSALASGSVDLGWMQPFALVGAQKKGHVVPLVKAVRHGLPFYRGVLFTKADRKVEGGLKGLQGLRVAWVANTSAAGYLFPRAAIVQAGLVPGKLFKSESFAGDHSAVCEAVLSGKADVGATFADDRPQSEAMQVDGCVQSVGAEAAKGLKIVGTSAPIPNDAIAARPGLDPEEASRIRKAFLGLKDDADGRALLQSVFKAESFDDVGDEDFEPVRFAADAATK